jgi:hypothetical protein
VYTGSAAASGAESAPQSSHTDWFPSAYETSPTRRPAAKGAAAWLAALAECGIESIRIGTKEMAFFPKRFDETFLAMLDAFHETYPQVGLHIMVHFEHPDEFLVKDDNSQYIQDEHGFYQWVPDTGDAMRGVLARSWITVENQTPIIGLSKNA